MVTEMWKQVQGGCFQKFVERGELNAECVLREALPHSASGPEETLTQQRTQQAPRKDVAAATSWSLVTTSIRLAHFPAGSQAPVGVA